MNRPRIGDVVTVRGLSCVIRVIRPFGTIDVQHVDSGRAYRVSGLWWTERDVSLRAAT